MKLWREKQKQKLYDQLSSYCNLSYYTVQHNIEIILYVLYILIHVFNMFNIIKTFKFIKFSVIKMFNYITYKDNFTFYKKYEKYINFRRADLFESSKIKHK